MKHSIRIYAALSFVFLCTQGCGKKEEPRPAPTASPQEIICSLAPSQSAIVNRISGAAGGASATAAALAQATGLTVVTHSSGSLILTGSGGYVAGTLGGAIAGPIIVGVGMVASGAAVTVELLCAPINHPDATARINDAASEFVRRSHLTFSSVKADATALAKKTTIQLQAVTGDIYEYAYRNN